MKHGKMFKFSVIHSSKTKLKFFQSNSPMIKVREKMINENMMITVVNGDKYTIAGMILEGVTTMKSLSGKATT